MTIDIQRELAAPALPDDDWLERWVRAALPEGTQPEICLRIVDEAEGRALNARWRGKDYATNVLSFPGSVPPGLPQDQVSGVSGDIVLCAPVVAREARAQHKSLDHHWAHLVVHGVLHLRGFDHIEAEPAEAMEALEREILGRQGIPDPYRPSTMAQDASIPTEHGT
ncbi:MAG: rRNA maturation RNase YbeY [Wenzhouxiangellaceae bacterium]